MIRFCIIFITILGLSVGIKLQLTEYRNWTVTSLTSNITLISKSSCSSFYQLFIDCGQNIEVKPDKSKSICCGFWEALDCVEKKAKDCSNKDQILSDVKIFQKTLDNSGCQDYKRDETTCGLQWWAILLIVIGCIAFVGVVGFFVYKKCKK
jgi:hypothetical protein